MTAALTLPQWVALAVALIAVLFDLRTRRIPNSLTFGAAGLAVCYSFATVGWSGLVHSVAGWLTALALFGPFFALGGLGAGDVKLAAAIGAWLGPFDALWMSLYSMIAGGVLGVVVALATGYFRKAIDNVRMLLMHWRIMGIRPLPEMTLAHGRGPRLPYAVPIATGALLVTLWR